MSLSPNVKQMVNSSNQNCSSVDFESGKYFIHLKNRIKSSKLFKVVYKLNIYSLYNLKNMA